MKTIQTSKTGLTVREAGWLLQKTAGQVRGMLARGELRRLPSGGRIDPESVCELVDDEFVESLVALVVSGAVIAPRPETPHGEPDSLPRNQFELMQGLFWGMVLSSLGY